MFWPFTVYINCSSDLKNFANSRASASNFKNVSQSLEQFFLTVGQNNFCNKIPFLGFQQDCWRFNKIPLVPSNFMSSTVKSTVGYINFRIKSNWFDGKFDVIFICCQKWLNFTFDSKNLVIYIHKTSPRAEIGKYFRSFFAVNENKVICFRNYLTFTKNEAKFLIRGLVIGKKSRHLLSSNKSPG